MPSAWTLFVDWPYLLPSIVAGFSGLLAAWSAYMYLPEASMVNACRAVGKQKHLEPNPNCHGSCKGISTRADPQTLPKTLSGAHSRETEKANEGGGIRTLLKHKRFMNVCILYGRECCAVQGVAVVPHGS
jgi:hypothetical protein